MYSNGRVEIPGPLIVQGTDVKAELEKNKEQIRALLSKCDDIESYIQYIFDNFQLKPEEKTILETTLDLLKQGAEAAGIINLILAGLSPGNLAIASFVLLKSVYKR